MFSQASLLTLLCAAFAVSCGADRQFSGVWRQVGGCGDATSCDGFVYELHLGRYGDDVAGVVVRYTDPGPDLQAFDRANECGCFLVESGRVEGDGLSFQLYWADAPGHTEQPSSCERAAEPECAGRLFKLEGDSDQLVGTVACDNGETHQVVFEAVRGRARSTCEPGAST